MSEKVEALREELAEKGLIFDGLSSKRSYVVLNHHAENGIQLSLRPLVRRFDDNTAIIFAKVRVAYDTDEQSQEAGDFAESKLVEQYHEANFPFDTRGNRRVRFLLAMPIAIGFYDGHLIEDFDPSEAAEAILNDVQARNGEPLTEYETAKGYLSTYIKERLALFTNMGSRATQSKGGLFGKVGPVVHWEGEYEAREPFINFTKEIAGQVSPQVAS